MNQNKYIKLSLELHLFFDRIMTEHSLFLGAAFMNRDNEMRRIAQQFEQTFSNILKNVIELADRNVSNELLSSKEIVTKNTLVAENKTNMLTDSQIDTNITRMELTLRCGSPNGNEELLNSIHNLNRQTLSAVQNLIQFKNDILNKVLACEMYTTNYPLLIKHIMNEAKMYHNLLRKIENGETFSENDIYEQKIFWNNIMLEHAEFIRGILDLSEEKLILTADKYANKYKKILQNYHNNPNYLTTASLNETINFRNFKIAGEEGILNCQIRSIIIPLLADHIVREANHFIRILKSFK